MGKKLDALLGRTFKTTKLKTLTKLAISRIAILKNQHQVRCSHARFDVIQLLNLGHQERALLRVEHVIKEQSMLDTFVMMEGYCHLVRERIMLIQNNKECPDELKEAISSLLFAASRCGGFPELQEIRKVFISWFGKDFAARPAELRNDCGVNPKIIQRLSTRQPSLESRSKVLEQIASENGITLHLEEDMYTSTEVGRQQQQKPRITFHLKGDTPVINEKLDADKMQKQLEPNKSASLYNPGIGDATCNFPEEIKQEEIFSESHKARKKYRDVAAAAQEAFEAAAYATAAARAAVELSRSESQDMDPDNHNDSNHRRGIVSDSDGSLKSKLHINNSAASEEGKHSNNGLGFDKIYPIDNFSSESEAEEMEENNYRIHSKESEENKKKVGTKKTLYDSSSDSDGDILGERMIQLNQLGQNDLFSKNIVFDGSDNESGKSNTTWFHHNLGSDRNPSLPTNEFSKIRQFSAVAYEDPSDENGNEVHYQSPMWIPLKSQADPMAHSLEDISRFESPHCLNSAKQLNSQHSNTDSKPVSARTRKVHRG
ncbi:hypothetical protein L1049_002482 [Liquidambar formosana]|uniref:IST1-like protein n=1 Tax=Liquidambar formosana TaxID=63359 RepID=A0AAP0R6Q9_LIQFO